ncbi:hypothetical protein [Halanaerobaculum tunisiense]
MPKFNLGGDRAMSTVLGVFSDQDVAKQAIEEMENQGVSEEQISLVAKQDETDDAEAGAEMTEGQNLTDGAATGGVAGGLAGALAGAGLLAVPGVGPLLAAGPLAAGLTGATTGGVAGGLVDYGLDEETGEKYAMEVEQGNILVAAEDTAETKIDDVADILQNKGANEVTTQ